MGDLVADDHPDAAVVEALREVLAVEEGLKDSRGENWKKKAERGSTIFIVPSGLVSFLVLEKKSYKHFSRPLKNALVSCKIMPESRNRI